MGGWSRIPEHHIMLSSRRTFWFNHKGANYSLAYDPLHNQRFLFDDGETSKAWTIEIQEMDGPFYKWQGSAWSDAWFPGGCAWFELFWDGNPKIVFWGDRVVIRQDPMVKALSE